MMNKMSNIYIPIDFSNVKNAIPPEEEIIYSTYAKITESDPILYTGAGIKLSKTTWLTHLLITPKGLAYEFHDTDGIKACYVPLYSTFFYHKILYVSVPHIKNYGVGLSLVRKPEYEKKNTFKKRSKEFQTFLRPFKLKVILDWAKETYSEFKNNPDYLYNDYILSHENSIPEEAFNYMKKFINEGKTLDEIIVLYTKSVQKH